MISTKYVIHRICFTKQTNEVITYQRELEALRNDIVEIYDMITGIQKTIGTRKSFEKLSLEDKILKLQLHDKQLVKLD